MGMQLQRAKRWHNAPFCDHETERNKPPFDVGPTDVAQDQHPRPMLAHKRVHLFATNYPGRLKFLLNRTSGSVATGTPRPTRRSEI